jgi:hypothetical protein
VAADNAKILRSVHGCGGFFIQDRAKTTPHSNAASIGYPFLRYSGFSPDSLANSSVVT